MTLATTAEHTKATEEMFEALESASSEGFRASDELLTSTWEAGDPASPISAFGAVIFEIGFWSCFWQVPESTRGSETGWGILTPEQYLSQYEQNFYCEGARRVILLCRLACALASQAVNSLPGPAWILMTWSSEEPHERIGIVPGASRRTRSTYRGVQKGVAGPGKPLLPGHPQGHLQTGKWKVPMLEVPTRIRSWVVNLYLGDRAQIKNGLARCCGLRPCTRSAAQWGRQIECTKPGAWQKPLSAFPAPAKLSRTPLSARPATL